MPDCKKKYCSNKGIPKKGGLCHTHYQKKWRENNPFKYHYNVAKQNAKKRKIPWKLTFKQWKKIWIDSGHWEDKLAQADNDFITWSLDRSDPNGCYEPGNVEVMELTKNVEKWIQDGRFNLEVSWRKRWSAKNSKPIEDCPF